MPINQQTNLSSLTTVPQLVQALTPLLQNTQQTVNGLTLNDLNLNPVTVNFSQANTQVTVAHGLGYVPNGYIPIQQDAAASIYLSTNVNLAGVQANATNIYLMASATVNVVLLFF